MSRPFGKRNNGGELWQAPFTVEERALAEQRIARERALAGAQLPLPMPLIATHARAPGRSPQRLLETVTE